MKVVSRKRVITVPHPTNPAMEEDWEIEEQVPMDQGDDDGGTFGGGTFGGGDVQGAYPYIGSKRTRNNEQDAWSSTFNPWDDLNDLPSSDNDAYGGTSNTPGPPSFSIPLPSSPDKNASPPVPPANNDNNNNNEPDKAVLNNNNNNELDDTQGTRPKDKPSPLDALPEQPSRYMSTLSRNMMRELQRYINKRALQTIKPLRDAMAMLTAELGEADARLLYRNGKMPEEQWLIRGFQTNDDEYAILRHNAGHLSKELLLLWMREWWLDRQRSTSIPPPRTPSQAPLAPGAGSGDENDMMSPLGKVLLMGASVNAPGPRFVQGIFQQTREVEQQLGRLVVPAENDIIDTPPWHFNLLNVDVVQDMILSDVGKGDLKMGLEALQFHIPEARAWTLDIILVSPVARTQFVLWTKLLVTRNHANGSAGRVYTSAHGGQSGSSMAINVSSGIRYLYLQSRFIRCFKKVFAQARLTTHPRVRQQQHEIEQMEQRLARLTNAQQQPALYTQIQQLTNRLSDAREQLRELRVRLPGQLEMPRLN